MSWWSINLCSCGDFICPKRPRSGLNSCSLCSMVFFSIPRVQSGVSLRSISASAGLSWDSPVWAATPAVSSCRRLLFIAPVLHVPGQAMFSVCRVVYLLSKWTTTKNFRVFNCFDAVALCSPMGALLFQEQVPGRPRGRLCTCFIRCSNARHKNHEAVPVPSASGSQVYRCWG